MLYPYTPKTKESPQPKLVVSSSLLEIKDNDLKDASRFLAKVNFTLPTNSYIVRTFLYTAFKEALKKLYRKL